MRRPSVHRTSCARLVHHIGGRGLNMMALVQDRRSNPTIRRKSFWFVFELARGRRASRADCGRRHSHLLSITKLRDREAFDGLGRSPLQNNYRILSLRRLHAKWLDQLDLSRLGTGASSNITPLCCPNIRSCITHRRALRLLTRSPEASAFGIVGEVDGAGA